MDDTDIFPIFAAVYLLKNNCNMVSKKFYVIVSILLSLVGTNSSAFDFVVDGIYYNYDASTQSAIVTYADGETIAERDKYKGDIVIPEKVFFNGRNMEVTGIGEYAFAYCTELFSISIPHTVKTLERDAFDGCSSLTSIDLKKVEYIMSNAFCRCIGLKRLTIPSTVKGIGTGAFAGCINLKTFVFEDGQDKLFFSDGSANNIFADTSIKSLYLGRNISEPADIFFRLDSITTLAIGEYVNELKFDVKYEDLADWYPQYRAVNCSVIYSLSENPKALETMRFPSNVYVNAKLFIPIGSKEKYKNTTGWSNFFNIEEIDIKKMWHGDGEPNHNNTSNQKCENPTISYSNGKLTFNCNTEGSICHSTITDSDIKSYSTNEVQLGVTYEISVYASKDGYENSETIKATLCWIDVEPNTEGISNDITSVRAMALLIHNTGGQLTINGIDDGTQVNVYSVSGALTGSTKGSHGSAIINTNLPLGSIAVVKIGEKCVKVLMK